MKNSPVIAVVLGSPGASAFAALPLLMTLDQENISADLIIATGGGALIASLWSAGYDLKQIEKLFTSHFTRDAFINLEASSVSSIVNERISNSSQKGSRKGLYASHSLFKAYELIFKDLQVEALQTKTLLYATDLESGEGYCIEKGPVATAVAACGAFYPVQAPVEMHGRLLADGSAISPLPVYEAVKRGADIIIAAYLNEKVSHEPVNFLESFLLYDRINTNSLRKAQLFTAIDMHHYEICIAEVPFANSVLPWDVEHIPEIVHKGKLMAGEKIVEIKEMIKNFTMPAKHGAALE